ncbi:MAG: DUF3866 family protein, partial [Sporichthyaceae bacterium]
MVRWRRGVVGAIRSARPGVVDLEADVDGERVRALAYTDLVGSPVVGDVVLLNVNALVHGLGTGGYGLVVALPERLPPDAPPPGHLVKARYTPLQAMVAGADEPGGGPHAVNAAPDEKGRRAEVGAEPHTARGP